MPGWASQQKLGSYQHFKGLKSQEKSYETNKRHTVSDGEEQYTMLNPPQHCLIACFG